MTQPLRIGIAGLGTVGAEVCRMLTDHRQMIADRARRPIDIIAVNARDRSKDRGVDLSQFKWFDDAEALAAFDQLDVFVELIGGEDGVAKNAVEQALGLGRSVVTANKALLAAHSLELAKLAEKSNCQLCYEAAVAGGIPVIKTIREALAGNKIEHVYGILNGTCNYILTEMKATGRPFDEVLKEAQEKGYAEADPAFDIGGQDAAHKLAIIALLAFGTETTIDDFYVEGISKVSAEDIRSATELGYTIKLLALAQTLNESVDIRVHPALVQEERRIAKVNDVTNAFVVDADPLGRLILEGPGAGGGATASAVIADLIDLARGVSQPVLLQGVENIKKAQIKPIEDLISEYYLRLSVRDETGVLASITDIFAEHDISLETIIQRGASKNGTASIIVVTHECKESVMRDTLTSLANVKGLIDEPHVIRIANI